MRPTIIINGKEIKNFTFLQNGIFIEKSMFEDDTPINGIIARASKCKYHSGYKWRVELKKPVATLLKRKPHIGWFLTRAAAEQRLKQIDQLL